MAASASPTLALCRSFLCRLLLCCAVAIHFFSGGSAANAAHDGDMATMVTRISASGFRFFGKIFAQSLSETLRDRPLSNQAVNFSREAGAPPVGTIYFEHLRVNEFVAPTVSAEPTTDGNVQLGTTGGTVNLSGRWTLNHTMDEDLALPSPAYGEFSIQTTNMVSRVVLEPFRDASGTPQLRFSACTVSMQDEDVNVTIKGIPKGNLERVQQKVGKDFKHFIEKLYCKGFPEPIDEMNTMLTKFQSGYPLAENITVQYTYSSMESEESVYTFAGFVDFLYDTTKCHLPQSAVDINKDSEPDNFMMTIWLSESVFNCFLDSLHRTYQTTWTPLIDQNTIILGSYLSTSCDSTDNCIGSFVPGLPEAYPNSFVQFYFISVNPPRMTFAANSSSASLSADLNVQMRLADTDQELVLLNAIVVAQLKPYIKNSRVCASLMGTPSLHFTVTKSEIGRDALRSSVWENIIHYVQPIIMAEVDQRLAHGLPLPGLSSVGISDANNRFSFTDHQVRIGFDLAETEPNLKQYDSPLDYQPEQQSDYPKLY